MSINIFIGDYEVKIVGFDSRNEMKQALLRCKNGFSELEQPEYDSAYYILYYNHYAEKERYGIGVYIESSSFPPSIIFSPNDKYLFITYNDHISSFDLKEKKIRFNHKLDGPVFFAKFYNDTVIVVSVLSVVQLSQNGDILMSHALEDVLESFEFSEGNLIYRTMGSINEYQLNFV